MSTLTQHQRAAIDLMINGAKPGPVRLEKFGFDNLDQYSTALETARSRLRNWFAVWGIHKIGDLDFVEPGCSAEGRIQKRAGVGKKRQN